MPYLTELNTGARVRALFQASDSMFYGTIINVNRDRSTVDVYYDYGMVRHNSTRIQVTVLNQYNCLMIIFLVRFSLRKTFQ